MCRTHGEIMHASARLTAVVLQYIEMRAKAEEVQEYGPRGVACPCCNQRARVTSSLPWESGVKVRYHKCDFCGWKGKSTQSEKTNQ